MKGRNLEIKDFERKKSKIFKHFAIVLMAAVILSATLAAPIFAQIGEPAELSEPAEPAEPIF